MVIPGSIDLPVKRQNSSSSSSSNIDNNNNHNSNNNNKHNINYKSNNNKTGSEPLLFNRLQCKTPFYLNQQILSELDGVSISLSLCHLLFLVC